MLKHDVCLFLFRLVSFWLDSLLAVCPHRVPSLKLLHPAGVVTLRYIISGIWP